MSYDLYLVDKVSREPLLLEEPHQMRGGTYQLGGCPEAHFNVTYNYSKHFYKVFKGDEGLRTIYGMTGLESIPVLQKAATQLNDDVSDDYWEATEGNARKALLSLISLAATCPDGLWEGD